MAPRLPIKLLFMKTSDNGGQFLTKVEFLRVLISAAKFDYLASVYVQSPTYYHSCTEKVAMFSATNLQLEQKKLLTQKSTYQWRTSMGRQTRASMAAIIQ